MLCAGAGFAGGAEAARAAEEAAAAALARAGVQRAEAALLVTTPHYGEGLAALLSAAAGALGTTRIAGASVGGVLAGPRPDPGGPALGVLAVAGLEAHPFLLADLAGHEARAGAELLARVGGPLRPGDLLVVFPDPYALDPAPLLEGLGAAAGPAALVGAGAADGRGGQPLQWAGGEIASGGLAGLLLRGRRPPRVRVTRSWQPASEPLRVTRCRGHWVLELDGRPALDVYRKVARGPLAADLRRAAEFLLVALPRGGSPGPGGCVVRPVAGFDRRRRAFAVPERVVPGDQLVLALREPEGARADLKAALAELAEPAPALGLYFGCRSRAALFGVAGLEAGYLERAFGEAPLLAVLGSCEIGPVAGRPELLTHSGVFALLDA